MTESFEIALPDRARTSVIALHCSLGSGRQWKRLAAELGASHQIITPDLSGYGDDPIVIARPQRARSRIHQRPARRRDGPDPSRRPFYGGGRVSIATACRCRRCAA
jgi:hypothetical protein